MAFVALPLTRIFTPHTWAASSRFKAEEADPASEVAAQVARERMLMASRQVLRIWHAFVSWAVGLAWIWSTVAPWRTGVLWLLACLLQIMLLWYTAWRFAHMADAGRVASYDAFLWRSTGLGALHGLLCLTFYWSVIPALPGRSQIAFSVAMVLLSGWLVGAGAVLRAGFLCATVIGGLSLMALWAVPGDLHGCAVALGLGALGLVTLGMRREQELMLHRGVLLGARNGILMREAAQRSQLIEAINQKKTEIIAAASHDLRQPVHALGLLVQRLQPRISEAEQATLFPSIRSRVSLISEMLGGLLDLSKLDSGSYQVRLERVHLRSLVQDVIELLQDKAQRKGLVIRESVADVDVLTDASLLKQILYNLVSNAVKYTREGEIAVHGSSPRRRHYTLEVVDTGQGIPQANLQEIFMEYFRLPPHRNGNEEGLGIGLTLVHRAASLLGYRLNVSSRVGVGSRFTVAIPRDRVTAHVIPEAPAPDTAPGELETNAVYTVIVLENDEVANEAMVQLLLDWGYRVKAGVSGQKLLAHLRAHPEVSPDLIISDMHLGEAQDGLACIAAIREMLRAPHLPGIVVTGDLSRELQVRATELGVRTLYKPLHPKQLGAAVRTQIRAGLGRQA